METKMRIKLYQPDGLILSDRLVEQEIEFRVGPKQAHKGPLSLELNLRSQEDIGNAVTYLQKLSGNLPIEAPGKKPKKVKLENIEDTTLESFVESLMESQPTQDEILVSLREQGFSLITYQHFIDLTKDNQDKYLIKDKWKDYQFMVRLVKKAKDPANDKWDFRAMIGIKLIGDKSEKVPTFLWGKFHKSYNKPWKDSKDSSRYKPKEHNILIFPEYMTLEERSKFRSEYRRYLNFQEQGLTDVGPFEFSKHYKRWEPFVTFK